MDGEGVSLVPGDDTRGMRAMSNTSPLVLTSVPNDSRRFLSLSSSIPAAAAFVARRRLKPHISRKKRRRAMPNRPRTTETTMMLPLDKELREDEEDDKVVGEGSNVEVGEEEDVGDDWRKIEAVAVRCETESIAKSVMRAVEAFGAIPDSIIAASTSRVLLP